MNPENCLLNLTSVLCVFPLYSSKSGYYGINMEDRVSSSSFSRGRYWIWSPSIWRVEVCSRSIWDIELNKFQFFYLYFPNNLLSITAVSKTHTQRLRKINTKNPTESTVIFNDICWYYIDIVSLQLLLKLAEVIDFNPKSFDIIVNNYSLQMLEIKISF